MVSLNVSVPSKLKAQIDERVASGEYDSADEYLRSLLRRDQQRRTQRELEQFLLSRLDKRDAVEMNAADFRRIRRQVTQRIGTVKRT